MIIFLICSCLNQWNYFFRAYTKYHGRLYFSCPSQDKCTNLWLLCNLPASIQITFENSIVSNSKILWLFIMFLKTLVVFLELVCIGHLYVFLSWRQTTWSILNIVKKLFFLLFLINRNSYSSTMPISLLFQNSVNFKLKQRVPKQHANISK